MCEIGNVKKLIRAFYFGVGSTLLIDLVHLLNLCAYPWFILLFAGICVPKLHKAYLLILRICTITMGTSYPLLRLKLVRLSEMRYKFVCVGLALFGLILIFLYANGCIVWTENDF
jgi:hypothetical protein